MRDGLGLLLTYRVATIKEQRTNRSTINAGTNAKGMRRSFQEEYITMYLSQSSNSCLGNSHPL